MRILQEKKEKHFVGKLAIHFLEKKEANTWHLIMQIYLSRWRS